MKKLKQGIAVVAIAFSAITIAGCSNRSNETSTKTSLIHIEEFSSPNFIHIEEFTSSTGIGEYIDPETKVHYLVTYYQGTKMSSITPRLNADGTLMTD